MYVVILGAGRTGSYLARELSGQYDVILIDKEIKSLQEASRNSDIATLHATAPSMKIFKDLMEHRPALFFAATGDDETNLVSCAIAKQVGFPKTIARVKNRDYLYHDKVDFDHLFGVDHFLAAEMLAAQDLLNAVIHAGDIASEHFAHGAIQMRTIRIPDRWDRAGTFIRDLALPQEFMIGLIRRKLSEGDTVLFPHGDDHLLPGDEITVVGESNVMHRMHELFHSTEPPVRSAILVGGTEVAFHLAHFLIQQGISIRLIEKDEGRCKVLAERLPQATVIWRGGCDLDLLKSERVQDVDVFISCLHDEGAGFLIASLAKFLGAPKVLSLTSRPSYSPLFEKMGILPALSAQTNAANRIVSILHEETIVSVKSLFCDAAKIVELKVAPSSPIVGIPLADLSPMLPKNLLIAVIENRGKVMVGKGNRVLSAQDTVIAICHPDQISQIPPLFHR